LPNTISAVAMTACSGGVLALGEVAMAPGWTSPPQAASTNEARLNADIQRPFLRPESGW
jgi:hypothetical protein